MKLFQVENEGNLYVVIAPNKQDAIDMLKVEYEEKDLEVTDERELKSGLVLHYDSEDIYWNN